MALIQTLSAVSHPAVCSARCTRVLVAAVFNRLNAQAVDARPDNVVRGTADQWLPAALVARLLTEAAVLAADPVVLAAGPARANQVHVDPVVHVGLEVAVPVLAEWVRAARVEEPVVADAAEPVA